MSVVETKQVMVSALTIVGIMFSVMIAQAEPKKTIPLGKDKDGNERHMVRLSKEECQDLAVEVYNAVKGSLVVIEGKTGVGSGFVAEADGKKWLYTNEHVTRIGHPLKAIFIDGREIAFGGDIEVAEDRDLARMMISNDVPALAIREEAPSLDELVFVYGNSEGGGVITKIFGSVLGVGDMKIEVDARFVRGNSGSALLDGKRRVVGVATEAALRRDPKDWTKADTRFNDIRRYGTRLAAVQWKKVDWQSYATACKGLQALQAYKDFLIPICFKDKELVTNYDVKQVRAADLKKKLKSSLARLVRQDKEFTKARQEMDDVLEKRKKLDPGNMQYPKKERVNIKYRKLRRELMESILERKNALNTATEVLRKLSWPVKRLEDDAADLLAGFEYCCTAYDNFNDETLSGINWHVD